MTAYIVRRVLYGALILLGVNLATFFLFFTVNTPDDMARLNIGGKRVTQEAIEKWKAERGYDKPLYLNAAKEGSERVTDTIFWERSLSLFKFDFGRADAESAGDIGHEVATRMWVLFQRSRSIVSRSSIASTASSRSASVPAAGSAAAACAVAASPLRPRSTRAENARAGTCSPSASATARAISLRSSRTLPGQG
jgi:hypothetical protein